MNLSLAKERVNMLVRMFTKKNNLKVEFRETVGTDFKQISLHSPRTPIVEGVNSSLSERWLSVKAQTAHESAHIVFTKKNVWEEAVKKGGIFPHIVNILEDARVERAISNIFPGTATWFRFLNEYMFTHTKEWGSGVGLALKALSAYSCVGRLPALDDVTRNLIISVHQYANEARTAKTTRDVFGLSIKVKEEFDKVFPETEMPEVPPMLGTGSPRNAPKGEIDPRREPEDLGELSDETSSDSEEGKSSDVPETSADLEEKPDGDFDEGEAGGTESSTEDIGELEPSSDSAHGTVSEEKEDSEFEPFEPDEDIQKALEEMDEELAAMSKQEATKEVPKLTKETLEGIVSKGLHQEITLHMSDLPENHESYAFLKRKMRGKTRLLTEEIKKLLEMRKCRTQSRLRKGKLLPRDAWRTKTFQTDIFGKKSASNIATWAIYLLVDCSGSMRGEEIIAARSATTMLHETCNTLGIPHKVTGFTSVFPRVIHLEAVDWEEEGGVKIASLKELWGNRDGYSIRVAAKELLNRPEKRKILISLSDGVPSDDKDPNYLHRTEGPRDTALAVREAEKQGIEVVSIYFGPKYWLPNVKTIYNNLVFCEELAHLPTLLGRVLKRTL